MNLQSMLRWAEKVLAVLDDPSLVAPSFCNVDRLNTKFQWLREYREDVALWSSWLALTDATLKIVRCNGYCSSTSDEVQQALSERRHLAETLVQQPTTNYRMSLVTDSCVDEMRRRDGNVAVSVHNCRFQVASELPQVTLDTR